ncbi:MAG: hypothetical protein U0174_24950 [Polyangiaceae bacterium]
MRTTQRTAIPYALGLQGLIACAELPEFIGYAPPPTDGGATLDGAEGDGTIGVDRDASDARDSMNPDGEPPACKRIFLSSSSSGNFGGRSSVDLWCKNRAIANGLSGSWLALIAVSGESATNAVNRTVLNPSAAGWCNLRGEVLFASGSDFPRNNPLASITYEDGTSVGNSVQIWTGMSSAAEVTCSDWNGSTGFFGNYAELFSDGGFGSGGWLGNLANTSGGCDGSRLVYCVEQ